MNVQVSSINAVPFTRSRGLVVAIWVAQLAVAGVLGMTAAIKFFNYTPEGSMALAQALGVGRGVITLIGLFEAAAVIAVLTPRLHAVGGLLGTLTALGALFSHATVIGFSGSAVAEMWTLAMVVLAASLFVLIGRWRELPFLGRAG